MIEMGQMNYVLINSKARMLFSKSSIYHPNFMICGLL
jgi:hypothetical protein